MTGKPYPLEKGLELEQAVIELEKALTAFEKKWNNMWGTPEDRSRRAKHAAEVRWARFRNGTD